MIYVPDVSVKTELTSLVGVRLGARPEAEAVSFDAKLKLEEKERKSQTVTVTFKLMLTTKPGVVKFEIDGTATMTGKDEAIRRMLDADPETKVPPVAQRVYQHAFTAMYLMSTLLNVPPPPQDLLYRQDRGAPNAGANVVAEERTVEVEDAITIQADTGRKDASQVVASDQAGVSKA